MNAQRITMRRVLRLLLWGLLTTVVLFGTLFGYFAYAPAPQVPRLSGQLSQGNLQVGVRKRTYMTYVPQGLTKGAALVVVMHGSGGNSAQARTATGYGFDRLADEHKFAVVYPNGYDGYWNACNLVGEYDANKINIDDVGFLTALVDKLAQEIGIDPSRVYATGISRGGHMAFRLALEAPARFRAVAAVAANVPVPANFKCNPTGQGTSSVMIMNGTKDPLNPYDGGEVTLFGLFKRGKVRSSWESGQYFADLNHIHGSPETSPTDVADGVRVEDWRWSNHASVEVELIAIHGGGHVIPQPYWRSPRILGMTPKEPNGPAVIWDFFARQRPR